MGNDHREWRDDASLIVPPRRYAVPTRRVRRDGGEDGGGERFLSCSGVSSRRRFVRSFVRSEDVRRGSSSFVVVPPTTVENLLLDKAKEIEIEETFSVHHADAVFEHGGRGGGVLRETVLERRVGARFGVFPARTAELYHC